VTRTEAVEELRRVLADVIGPRYAWDTDRLMRLLSIGQDQFCKDTGFFTDFSTYTLATEANVASYAIDPRIIQVLEAWYGDIKLQQFYQGQRVSLPPSPGQPIQWQTDQQTGKLTFWPALNGVYQVSLRVWRRSLLPLNHKRGTVYDTEFELPDDSHHLACVEYAAYKALGDHDRELQDPVKALEHLNNYKVLAREGKRDFQRLSGGVGNVVPNTLYVV